MSQRSDERCILESKFASALLNLLEALEYAEDVDSDRWEFAVSIRQLAGLGLNETDFRWLVRKGYVEHAREVTPQGDNGRHFRPTGDLMFAKRTCFVLTEAGAAVARSNGRDCQVERGSTGAKNNRRVSRISLPVWDAENRTLYVDKVLVKRFKWRAENQEAILSAFQEEGWPRRVDDPLPPKEEQDSKRRLSDTIKCLNKKHAAERIRFHGDGTGEGVVWELVESGDDSTSLGDTTSRQMLR